MSPALMFLVAWASVGVPFFLWDLGVDILRGRVGLDGWPWTPVEWVLDPVVMLLAWPLVLPLLVRRTRETSRHLRRRDRSCPCGRCLGSAGLHWDR